MLLLNEKNSNVVSNYDVKYISGAKDIIFGKITTLLENPNITIRRRVSSDFPLSAYQMKNDVDAPLIKDSLVSDYGMFGKEICRRELSYQTPFTLSFLYNTTYKQWGLPPWLESEEKIEYLKRKSDYIEKEKKTFDLNTLYRNIDFKESESLSHILNTLSLLDDPTLFYNFLRLNYPDIAAFSEIFPYVELYEKKDENFSIEQILCDTERNLVDLSFQRKNEIESAQRNTEILKLLKIKPRIFKK